MATLSSSNKKIKFHYGFGGTITPGKNSGKLRYKGGTNGILKVDRGITYTELVVKLWDASGPSMRLRCKLPHDDLDSLVHVRSDEDLAYVLEEYDCWCTCVCTLSVFGLYVNDVLNQSVS
ncbi:putative PB1 domain-containing protein [Helianthus annuus]|uniref:PB1 domain-containing protein n=1 Tax=Helianthus annuus TaxID=4232 RepID=A0A251U9F9_HELAN|nr:putative PB1 domain-containing protein [Helianthus annuus]KAJ0549235.1 putative PB1 domain-containing protein [Helianthus annuus]KAJ0562191.1 putative PB1 domain-containing protein [Helianthus annuus]KAJ0730359.1 putative PB1 domain-containing protein [Helianthus annuus]KAJ0790840.1 putative PB1 domain-containing protein [Helianthus annuus]